MQKLESQHTFKHSQDSYFSDKELDDLVYYLENNDIEKFLSLLKKISKFYGISQLAVVCGRNRASFYKIFDKKVDPKIKRLSEIFKLLGLTFTVRKKS